MHILTVLHRWWGLAFCLLFAMWFASGIVMHFVPFPRSEAGRSGVAGNGGVRSEREALLVAAAYARQPGIDLSHANIDRIDYDQWTVVGEFDIDRPFYRVALGDDAGTELYVSSATGDIVLSTTQNGRLANYLGSVVHWIYPAGLRHNRQAWSVLMRLLSLAATLGAVAGVAVGLVRLRTRAAYVGLQRWHHVLGLMMAPFILCWIFSGLLSTIDGLFPHEDELFRALHTLDFPPLTSHPVLRTGAIVALCLFGLAFSLTGVMLALQRLRMTFAKAKGNF